MLQLWKFDDLKYQLDIEMEKKGLTNYEQIKSDTELFTLLEEVKATDKFINKMGYSNLTPEQYREKVQQIEENKYSQNKSK